jgi:hypothetical protein
MASRQQIEQFLSDFKQKLAIWGILFRSDRGKNFETMKQLEYSVENVKTELKNLDVTDYSEGPLSDTLYRGASMWVFGKTIQGKEVYIKITLGQPGEKVICISFHFAERTMTYPYK